MFARSIGCAALVALSVSSTFAGETVVNDGDYYAELRLYEGSFVMHGGRVDALVLNGGGSYQFNGGEIGPVMIATGTDLTVRGGDFITGVHGGRGIFRTERFGGYFRGPITFEGRYFRVYDAGYSEANWYRVEGWLADGSFLSISLGNDGEFDTASLPVHFKIVPGARPAGDSDGDWDTDLNDLNNVRNNFGGAGLGDLNVDGLVDLADLNEIRNAFGNYVFTLDRENPNSFPYDEITADTSYPPGPQSPVPEPTTLAIGIIACAALATRRRWPAP